MNERFKFRAWFPSECWQDSRARMIENVCLSAQGKVMHLEGGWDYMGDDEKAIPMQSTGLKDKNGKLIYESDLIKTDHNVICEVFFDQQRAKWAVRHTNYWTPKRGKMLYKSLPWAAKFEVISNVYEHPELLN